jgi:spore cortex formation protein SpoVR/YcgB (stage V sporulation)/intein/homing endonuclease
MKTPLFRDSNWNLPLLEEILNVLAELAGELRLNTYPNQIEIISSEQMLDAYASSGLPVMYKHWSFGKRFSHERDQYRKGRTGLAYEIVLNSNPCISYLMEENSATMQTLVLAHAAFGHNHFFKNNYLFQNTAADSIIDYLVFAKKYIDQCEEKYGQSAVEKTLDHAHALQSLGVDRSRRPRKISLAEEKLRQKEREEYLDSQINDLWYRTVKSNSNTAKIDQEPIFPERPEENFLYFLEKNSPTLQTWQREILRIVRKISQYLQPQRECLIGSHRVATPSGMVRLDSLIKSEGYIENSSIQLLTNGDVWTPISHTYKNLAETIKITTKTGRTFTGTPEHPLQTLSDDGTELIMKPIGDMKTGDYLPYKLNYHPFTKESVDIKYPRYVETLSKCKICDLEAENISSHVVQKHKISVNEYKDQHGEVISSQYRLRRSANPLMKRPEKFDESVSRIFAYLLNSSRSLRDSNQSTFEFKNDNLDVLLDFKSCLNKSFGINVEITLDLFGKQRILFNSLMLKDLFNFNVGEINRRLQIPEFVFSLNEKSSENFIRAYFDSVNSLDAFERSSISLKGYSCDEGDFSEWATLLICHGIVPILKKTQRESFESLANMLGIQDASDKKACNYTLYIPSTFLTRYNEKIGTLFKNDFCDKKINTFRIPKSRSLLNQVKQQIEKEKIIHSNKYKSKNYDYKVKNNLLLRDQGFRDLDKMPRDSHYDLMYRELVTNKTLITILEKIKDKIPQAKKMLEMIEISKETYFDEIVKIEQGPKTYVYDVTVPENHLFWCDGLISHNTKVMNEGWASFVHYYLMNRLYDLGYITEGSMLEFLKSHTSVVFQPDFDSPYYSGGFNPYYLGFEIFQEIRRICENPSAEDLEYFPNLVNQNWLDTCLDAVENYRDESFIRQFLSPNLVRKMRLFQLEDIRHTNNYTVKSIHDTRGFRNIRSQLADSYEIENLTPKIEIVNADLKKTRRLTIQYHQHENRTLNRNYSAVLKHVQALWGHPVELNQISDNGIRLIEKID